MPDPISWSFVWPYYLAALAVGYLIGSIPFGLLIARAAGLGDIRRIGSGNIGATNVLRAGGKKLAVLTVLLDSGKGGVAAYLALRLYGLDMALLAGFGAFLGHLFPIFLKFRGGKGVATYLGVLLALAWPAGLAFVAVWLAVAIATRYSSLAALTASLAAPLVLVWLLQWQMAEMFAVMTLFLWVRHAPNIRRLVKGVESRIGEGAVKITGEATNDASPRDRAGLTR